MLYHLKLFNYREIIYIYDTLRSFIVRVGNCIYKITEIVMKKSLIFVVVYLLSICLFAQLNSPKEEFRGAWIASVANLDWPSAVGLSPQQQRDQLIRIFDEMKEVNMNAAILQIRPECDALYDSPYDPWSYWLTGRQGRAPEPYYDPLTFAIEEAHKRGIELHAWFNPYRVTRSVSGTYPQSDDHVSQKNPDWVIRIGNIEFLDPGLPMVQEYVRNVVMDVVNRYDIDGIHMDDYFYPYPPDLISNEDDDTFAQYNRGFTNRGDWRRDNINLLLRMINDSLKVVKPHVKFGMSPFGIWKSGTPQGIIGLNAYSTIYCDAIAWLQDRSIDYLTPQCYWQIGGNQDYFKLSNWWGDSVAANERHFYPGQGLYRQSSWAANEIPRQIIHNRGNDNIHGSIMFRVLNLRENTKGVTDSLSINYFQYPAITPAMDWKDQTIPSAPVALKLDRMPESASTGLQWEVEGNDTGRFFLVYLFDTDNVTEEDLNDPSKIIQLTGNNYYIPSGSIEGEGPYYFGVSALSRNSNESPISSLIGFSSPAVPELAFPADEAIGQADTTILTWRYAVNAGSYRIQVASDTNFTEILVEESDITDSIYAIAGLSGLQTYYWRVMAENIVGESGYSDTWSFTTGFPIATTLLYPPTETTEVPERTEFVWNYIHGASYYRLQIVRSVISWSDELIVVDVSDIQDTTYTLEEPLILGELYSWRVIAGNGFGQSLPSEIFKFQVNIVSSVELSGAEIPSEFDLYQNYPNPFNPSTQINFDIPEGNYTVMKIYDALGQEIETLVDDNLKAGRYTITFDASSLPSGIYIYTLTSGESQISKKMMFVK